MAINKKEFADRMAENGGITKKAAYQAIDAFIETVMDYLGDGEIVRFQNFGRFEIRDVKGRIGRNPMTGEKCMIPEYKKVKFTASETLADRIMESRDTYINENE